MTQLNQYMRETNFKVATVADSKDEVLQHIAGLASVEGLPETSILLKAFKAREKLGSTGFGNGVAIPHCRLDAVENFHVGLVTFSEGAPFDSLDEQPIRVAAWIVAPTGQSSTHIRLLSTLSRVLSVPGAVEELCACASRESLYEVFMRRVTDEADPGASPQRMLFRVFVQSEDLFTDILQVFQASDYGHSVVSEAENPSTYLERLPLFSGFWTDQPNQFCRLITAVVHKDMTHETLRRIERITGPLAQCDEVLVTVQELYYCEGALSL